MPRRCPLLVLNGRLDPALARWLGEVRGGRIPDALPAPFSAEGELLAVDGGADRLRSADLPAALVAGDLDSVSAEGLAWHRNRGAAIVELSDQSANDLEKALALARSRGAERCCIAAFEGTRLDMLLGLFALLPLSGSLPLLLLGADQLARALPAGRHRLPTAPGVPFSLVAPSQAVAVTLVGARWPLEAQEPLRPGCRGVSNRATGDELLLDCDGPLLHFSDAPWSEDRP